MSLSKAQYEARRWLKTAEEDLEAARALHQVGKFSHTCFLAQQSAEKAIKALWLFFDEDPWGHSIQKLIRQYPKSELVDDLDTWILNAAFLDKFYIPTRYPNGLPDLTPGQTYVATDAEQAIEKADFFISRVIKVVGDQ